MPENLIDKFDHLGYEGEARQSDDGNWSAVITRPGYGYAHGYGKKKETAIKRAKANFHRYAYKAKQSYS